MGCMVLELLATSGNQAYPDLWVVTGDPWYSGYQTPKVALKPSIERVVGVVHSMGGRISIHMILRVPPWDSEV
jgi:hypothetical protein